MCVKFEMTDLGFLSFQGSLDVSVAGGHGLVRWGEPFVTIQVLGLYKIIKYLKHIKFNFVANILFFWSIFVIVCLSSIKPSKKVSSFKGFSKDY